jgi:L-seryl-tRNA(Ser) seleniumtransferase
MENDALRRLPSVDVVLRSEDVTLLLARFPRLVVTDAVRAALEFRRRRLRDGGEPLAPMPAAGELEQRIREARRSTLRRAINATGVVLHTNLGRAPLPAAALSAVAEIGAGYSTLEYDPDRRERSSRQEHCAALLAQLANAEGALVVNNNAAAVVVALAALAGGREVIVSRGELVEIGGGFRIPEVMRASGARLREVGTTNKTRLRDYADAISSDTALLLKVHRSNFAMIGFTEEVELGALAALGKERGLPVMIDLGSGALIDSAALGLPAEPTVAEALARGADLATFSGDKLLGGPQAGLLVGRRAVIDKIAAHPLMRALRPDKLTLAALVATLAIYKEGTALEHIPTLRMLATPTDVIARRMQALLDRLGAIAGLSAQGRQLRSTVGGGALPLAELDTWAVSVRAEGHTSEALAQALAANDPSVITRIQDQAVMLDLRTVSDDEVPAIATAIATVLERALGPVGRPPPPEPNP